MSHHHKKSSPLAAVALVRKPRRLRGRAHYPGRFGGLRQKLGEKAILGEAGGSTRIGVDLYVLEAGATAGIGEDTLILDTRPWLFPATTIRRAAELFHGPALRRAPY